MKRFKNILCYVGGDASATALSKAVELAIENDARLVVMDVIRPMSKIVQVLASSGHSESVDHWVVEDHEKHIWSRLAEFSDTIVDVQVLVTTGDPVIEIVRQVVSQQFDLVIKTADGFEGSDRVFGSLSRSLLRLCPCPVWALKPDMHGIFDRILVAVDVDQADEQHRQLNRDLLELAYSFVDDDQTQLHIVCAWNFWMEGPMRRRSGNREVDRMVRAQEAQVHDALDELLQVPMAIDERVLIHIRRGPAASIVLSVAESTEADLVVMGTVCRTGVAGFLIGNTAESVIPELQCSLLALKPQGFVPPLDLDSKELPEAKV